MADEESIHISSSSINSGVGAASDTDAWICILSGAIPDKCSSESDAEHSDHGEELAGICTPDMLGPDGIPKLEKARVTPEQAKGKAGGLVE
jgi:hypothetical protein